MTFFNPLSSKMVRKMLRQNMPKAEVLFWLRVRNRQLGGLKFKRQFGVGPFIVDFCCPSIRTIIEIDGDSHWVSGEQARDAKRQRFLEACKFDVLRFTNLDVYTNLNGVLESILEHAKTKHGVEDLP